MCTAKVLSPTRLKMESSHNSDQFHTEKAGRDSGSYLEGNALACLEAASEETVRYLTYSNVCRIHHGGKESICWAFLASLHNPENWCQLNFCTPWYLCWCLRVCVNMCFELFLCHCDRLSNLGWIGELTLCSMRLFERKHGVSGTGVRAAEVKSWKLRRCWRINWLQTHEITWSFLFVSVDCRWVVRVS